MNIQAQDTFKILLALSSLAFTLSSTGCDTDEVLDEDELELSEGEDLRAAPVCEQDAPQATKWRIRNASVQENTGQWVFRELAFCADAACEQPLTGTAIDSGDSASWAPPEYAFDGDTSTLWKTFDTDVAGQSWIGLDFGTPTAVHGLYLKTDNVVYSVDTIYVEYYDAESESWVIADYLGDVPSGSELTYDVHVRERFPSKWRVRNASVQENSGQWVFREIDFCADNDCTEVENGGTAIDSGDSRSWSLPENAFDDDTGTLWKTFDTDVAGQSWLGMDYGDQITEIEGLYLKTDNVVYSVDTIFVEYFDIIDQEWVTSDYLSGVPSGSELTFPVAAREHFPTKWRLRNGAVQANTGQWVFREIDFCADEDCTEVENGGTAIDSGDSRSWSLPENAFDDDTSTLWKTFDTDVVGQSWLGMDYGRIVDVAGVYLKTDNVVYSVDTIDVEYFDVVTQTWELAETLSDVPSGSELTEVVDICN
ncbi:discoidin domain-containing protein [Pseudenhygromyxa sp. WMMC2535]|uniref:discoidin domain-containing protein n=1 Tax=Pseudenhygromyxa sp. WMMC2535 TaxID=2712867 RepID=UPI00155545C5|nr:discoidin domain-containing protein [Pseudenhygromyxa sp. WMMC2535]NVB43173.1 discoidin domain-containing protein [Pseudenhygromyxa sp. WMMC2535]